MNILHIDCGREMRGGQYQVQLLMEALDRRGHRQLLLSPGGSPLPGAATLCWRIPLGFDVIHAHDARSHTRAMFALGGTPLVVSRRVAFPVRKGLFSKWKYSRASHYVAVSNYVRGQLLEAGVPEDKITVVYDGVRPAALAVRREGAEREGPFVAGAIPAPPEKPQDLFLEAAARRPALRTVIVDPGKLFDCDVLVYLSNSEGLGSGILLAMAQGIAVIASNTGGIPEIVTHEKTGLLVENTVESVGRALDRLSADRDLCRAMGEAGRRWLEQFATDDILALRTEAVYRKVLESVPLSRAF
jgi:glycosyltransferase involved in cell wall biosynthesis